MKKLTVAVLVAVLASVAVSMADNEYTPKAVVKLDFKGKVTGLDGKPTKVETSNISTAGLYWATITRTVYDTSGSNVVATGTNDFSVLASSVILTNLPSIAGGTNLIQQVWDWNTILDTDASAVTSKGKFTADFYGDAQGTNITRDITIVGTIKQNKKTPTEPKINGKVVGIWLDGVSSVVGTVKNAKAAKK